MVKWCSAEQAELLSTVQALDCFVDMNSKGLMDQASY